MSWTPHVEVYRCLPRRLMADAALLTIKYRRATGRSCDQILRVGFTLLGIFPDITDRISSIAVGQ